MEKLVAAAKEELVSRIQAQEMISSDGLTFRSHYDKEEFAQNQEGSREDQERQ